MTDQNKMLKEELEKRLLWYREEASPEEFDADEVDAICTMLLKLSPENRPRRTKEEAYQSILRQIDLEEGRFEGEKTEEIDSGVAGDEETDTAHSAGMFDENIDMKGTSGESSGKRRHLFAGRRGLRAAVIFLAVAGVLTSLNMVSYARENKSLFTMILERVGWLEIEKDVTVESDLVDAGWTAGEFYDSWAELDSETKQKITVPDYIPAGYSLFGIECWNSNNREIVKAEYYDQRNGHIHMEITLWEDNADQYKENATDERIYELIPEYSDEKTLYYAYEDEYICMIFMDNSFYRISGNIALEDMVKIGESL